jgi:hypothetical protein
MQGNSSKFQLARTHRLPVLLGALVGFLLLSPIAQLAGLGRDTEAAAEWTFGNRQLTKIGLPGMLRSKIIPMAAQAVYHCHEFEGYLGNVGLNEVGGAYANHSDGNRSFYTFRSGV